MPSFRRRHVVLIGQVAASLALLALLWRAFSGAEALRLVASADVAWLAAALAVLTVQTFLSAERWRLTARQLGQVLSFGHALREYYLAQLLNQILPGGIGGDAGRAIRTRGNGGLATSGQAVVFERLAGQAALLLVTAAGVAWAIAGHGGPALPGWALGLVAAAVAAVSAAGLSLWLLSGLPGRFGRLGGALRRSLAAAFLQRGVATRQVLLSLGTTTCNLLGFAFCARATGTALAPSAVMVLVPLILFAMVIPASVAGWGFREGAAAALFPLAGASQTAGLGASIAFGLVFLASALPGLLVLLGGCRSAESRGSGRAAVPDRLPSADRTLS